MKISLLHTTARVDGGWWAAYAAWLERAHNPAEVEYILSIDSPDALSYPPPSERRWGRFEVVINTDRPCPTDGFNRAARASSGELLAIVADDWFPPQDWDRLLLERIPDLAAPHAVEVAERGQAGDLMTHPIVTRAYYSDFGYIFHPEMPFLCADNEFTAVARASGCLINARELEFVHQGPPDDQIMRRAGASFPEADRMFKTRRDRNFPRAFERPAPERQVIIGTVAYMGGVMAVPEPFNWSWGNLCAHSEAALCQPGEHLFFDHTSLSLHDYARNDIAGRMKGDWLLMLDTDIAFDPDLCARMVAAMYRYDVEILTGIYCYKSPPHYPVLYIFNHESDRHEVVANWDRSSELFQISSAGAGVLLVRRRVFERITEHFKASPFDRLARKGEDHSFFARARELGIKAYCAWKIEVDHLAYQGLKVSTDYVFDPTVPIASEFQMETFSPARIAAAGPARQPV